MMIQIRDLTYSEQDYATAVAVWNEAWPEMYLAVSEWKHMREATDPQFLQKDVLAEQDGEPIALGRYYEPYWAHQPGKIEVVICVRPDFQRQGVATAVYDHIMQALQDREVVYLTSYTHEHKTDAVHFLTERGFQQVLREPVSQLDVDRFNPADFANLMDKVATTGIQILPLNEAQTIYPDWGKRLWELEWELVQDVPSPDGHSRSTLESFMEEQVNGPWFEAQAWTVAVSNGRFIGMSILWILSDKPDMLYSGLTGVVRVHRRQGIATAMKVRGIQFAKDYGAKKIETMNEENNPMFALNRQLGFEPQPAVLRFEKRL